ncbi:hypothetical protein SASPL_141485 [Salvia splendens]|uniref:Uncharacterized protein n=1 Tax=Salvia splendens TaxID=180675 RepID=A0A8X8WS07_SALSN|nr:hypothetical protein SASPL_141485 [Salvia splendens]
MRKGYSHKMWWVVACRSKESLRRETRMDIEEILKMKLETIEEEDSDCAVMRRRSISKKIHLKAKMGNQLRLKESYVIFMAGFAFRGGLNGLPRY